MTTDERVASLEATIRHLAEELLGVRADLRGLAKSLDDVDRNLVILTTQKAEADKAKNEAEKRLSRWKNAAITFGTAVALAGFMWIAKIAWVVQTARAMPGQ